MDETATFSGGSTATVKEWTRSSKTLVVTGLSGSFTALEDVEGSISSAKWVVAKSGSNSEDGKIGFVPKSCFCDYEFKNVPGCGDIYFYESSGIKDWMNTSVNATKIKVKMKNLGDEEESYGSMFNHDKFGRIDDFNFGILASRSLALDFSRPVHGFPISCAIQK